MKATITNNSRANQGVHTVDGLVFIEPGRSQTLTIAESYVERAKALPFLRVEPKGAATEAAPTLADSTVAELRAIAEAESIDLGDATKKADVIAAIELAREAKAAE